MGDRKVCARCGGLIHRIAWQYEGKPHHGACVKLEREEDKAREAEEAERVG